MTAVAVYWPMRHLVSQVPSILRMAPGSTFLVMSGTGDAHDTRKVNLVGYASEKTVAALNGTKACDSTQYKKIKKDEGQEVPKAKVNPKQQSAGSKNKR